MVAAGPWQQAAEKRHTSPAQWQDPLLYPLSYGGSGRRVALGSAVQEVPGLRIGPIRARQLTPANPLARLICPSRACTHQAVDTKPPQRPDA